jgi:predicted amidohydrolase
MEQLAVLQFKSGEDFAENLTRLITLFEASDAQVVLAPEVCLTGFCFGRMADAARFGDEALLRLLEVVGSRILVLTVIEELDGGFYNVAKVLHDGVVVHQQAKHKLFLLGDEHHHFQSGTASSIRPFEVGGITMAILVCFELRFPELWQQVEGAELIMVPAMWGKNRATHLAILSQALAVANRAYVMVADSANDDMGKESAVITPWGERSADNATECITRIFDRREIKKIKRAIPYE